MFVFRIEDNANIEIRVLTFNSNHLRLIFPTKMAFSLDVNFPGTRRKNKVRDVMTSENVRNLLGFVFKRDLRSFQLSRYALLKIISSLFHLVGALSI